MEAKQQSSGAQAFFSFDEREDQTLINFLNANDKGGDTFVFQFGSHSIKYGLSTQIQPFMVPNVIAYPARAGNKTAKIFNPPLIAEGDSDNEDDQKQILFDEKVQPILQDVVKDLRNKNAHLIDEKSMKNIRKGNVSYRVYNHKNSINCYEDTQKICYSDLTKQPYTGDLHQGMEPEKFQLITNPQQYMDRHKRQFLYGTEVSALHAGAQFVIRRPIRYGNLNITDTYTGVVACQDLQNILQASLKEQMKLNPKQFKHFNAVLVISDTFVKHHVRHLLNMLFVQMGFKSVFVHVESVMATYAMAAQTACVVDIGSSKISVCCVDDGVILSKTIMKKHFGGDDLSELTYRLLKMEQATHYFPKNVFHPLEYPYHWTLLEQTKEQYSMLQMNESNKDLVKIITLWLKEQDAKTIGRPSKNKKLSTSTQVTFNCSDALLLAPHALYYSQLLQALRACQDVQSHGDPLLSLPKGDQGSKHQNIYHQSSYMDPEDLIHDIMQGMLTASSNPSSNLKKEEEKQDVKMEDEQAQPEIVSHIQTLQEAMDLDEMICRSICTVENADTRKRLAAQIVLVGGVPKTDKFVEWMEDNVYLKIREKRFDESIASVEVQLVNLQQQQQYIIQQQMLAAQNLPVESPSFKVDPRFCSWIGGSVIPKLDSSKDMFVTREKYMASYCQYDKHFEEAKTEGITQMQQNILQQRKAAHKAQQEQAEKNKETQIAETAKLDEIMEEGDGIDHVVELSFAQEESIKKEVAKRLKKDRNLEGGVRLVREKAAFQW